MCILHYCIKFNQPLQHGYNLLCYTKFMKNLIFTDLDGTFLNHHDYSFEESKEALGLVKKKQIPLIFTTSKTRIEVEELQSKVGINDIFSLLEHIPTGLGGGSDDFIAELVNAADMQLCQRHRGGHPHLHQNLQGEILEYAIINTILEEGDH